MRGKDPLDKAALEVEAIRNLFSRFEQQRTVGQHERLAFKIVGRTVVLNSYLAEHVASIRKPRSHRKDTNRM